MKLLRYSGGMWVWWWQWLVGVWCQWLHGGGVNTCFLFWASITQSWC